MDEVATQAGYIYHLAPRDLWESQRSTGWFLTKDLGVIGFIHCTSTLKVLLSVANAYYRGEPGEFVVMKIEEDLLSSRVKYESPAAVHVGDRTFDGNQHAPANGHPQPSEGNHAADALMPHVFGPINLSAVVDVYPAVRDQEGHFVSV